MLCRELDGGHPLWALEALTGDDVFKYHRSGCVCVCTAGDKSQFDLATRTRVSELPQKPEDPRCPTLSAAARDLRVIKVPPAWSHRETWRKLDLVHSGKRGPHGCKFTDSGDEALSDDDMFQVTHNSLARSFCFVTRSLLLGRPSDLWERARAPSRETHAVQRGACPGRRCSRATIRRMPFWRLAAAATTTRSRWTASCKATVSQRPCGVGQWRLVVLFCHRSG